MKIAALFAAIVGPTILWVLRHEIQAWVSDWLDRRSRERARKRAERL